MVVGLCMVWRVRAETPAATTALRFDVDVPASTSVPTGKALAGKDIRALFFGNSMTYFWSMPEMLGKLAGVDDLPGKLKPQRAVIGGMTLTGMLGEGPYAVERKEGKTFVEQNLARHDGKWDVVVLQPYSRPENRDDITRAVPKIVKAVREAKPDAKIILYMVENLEHHKAKDKEEEGLPTATPQQVADALQIDLLDSARLWAVAAKEKPDWTWKWKPNDSHPSPLRAYLTSCLMYAKVYDKSPVGLAYTTVAVNEEGANPYGMGKRQEELSDEQATYCQQFAARYLKGEFDPEPAPQTAADD